MKLIGMMLVRNEEWVIRASIQAALRWCDELVVLDDDSSDSTPQIIWSLGMEYGNRLDWSSQKRAAEHWSEMNLRQTLFENARKRGGTHYAIIDADEILTANLDDKIRGEFEKLGPGECMEVPMLAMRALDVYQDDDSVWSGAWLTLGFGDAPALNWKPAEDGYQHHSRAPRCAPYQKRFLRKKEDGGVMHLQFANRRRLLAKHWLYAYSDWLRWPERDTPQKVSWRYSMALEKPGHLGAIPLEWWSNRDRKSIKLDGVPWQEDELRRLVAKHGEAAFSGIKLIQERPV